jgi:hypothetical protein
MKIYKCQNTTCKYETEDLIYDHWLEIGSSDNKNLFINNHLDHTRIMHLGNHNNIHFCSLKCLTNYLCFDENKK